MNLIVTEFEIEVIALFLYLLISLLDLLDISIRLKLLKLKYILSNSDKINIFKIYLLIYTLKFIDLPFDIFHSIFKKKNSERKFRDYFTFAYSILISAFVLFMLMTAFFNFLCIPEIFILSSKNPQINIGIKNVITYIALTITLITVSYFPDKIYMLIDRRITSILKRLFRKETQFFDEDSELNKKYIIFLRPKLWVYLISIFITTFQSIEQLLGSQIIQNPIWQQIKPVVFQSVITLIVIDRFAIHFKKEVLKLRAEANLFIEHENFKKLNKLKEILEKNKK